MSDKSKSAEPTLDLEAILKRPAAALISACFSAVGVARANLLVNLGVTTDLFADTPLAQHQLYLKALLAQAGERLDVKSSSGHISRFVDMPVRYGVLHASGVRATPKGAETLDPKYSLDLVEKPRADRPGHGADASSNPPQPGKSGANARRVATKPLGKTPPPQKPTANEAKLYYAAGWEENYSKLFARHGKQQQEGILSDLEIYVALSGVFGGVASAHDHSELPNLCQRWKVIVSPPIDTAPHVILSDFALRAPTVSGRGPSVRFASRFGRKEGWKVALYYLRPTEDVSQVVELLQANGSEEQFDELVVFE